jgi:hypothetical protein
MESIGLNQNHRHPDNTKECKPSTIHQKNTKAVKVADSFLLAKENALVNQKIGERELTIADFSNASLVIPKISYWLKGSNRFR